MIKPQNTFIWIAFIFCIVLGQDKNYNNFQEGLSLERSGKIEEAIIIYKEILNNAPDHQPSFFQLKNIYYNRSKNKDGIEVVSKWLANKSSDLQSMLLLSEFYFRDSNEREARKIWAQFEKDHLSSKSTYRMLFHTYAKYNQVKEMERLVKISRDKLNEPYLFSIDLANYFQARQTFSKAVDEYILLITYQKQYLQFVTDRILLISDDETTHEMIVSKLNNFTSNLNESRSILAAFYFKTGNYELSFEENKKIVTTNINDIKRWEDFATNLRKEKEYDISIRSYHYLLQNFNVNDPKILGDALLGLGFAYEDQISENQNKLKFTSWYADNIFFPKKIIGSKSFKENSFLNTIEHYQSVLTLLPSSHTTAIVHYKLGEIQANVLDDYDGALFSYEAAKKSSPNENLKKEINLKIGKLLMNAGKLNESLDYFHPGKKFYINDRTVNFINSMLYQGQINNTISFLDTTFMKIEPDNIYFNDFIELKGIIDNFYSNGTADDKYAFTLFFKSENFINQNKINEAINTLQMITSDHESALIYPLALKRLSLIFLALNEKDKAKKIATQLIDNIDFKDQALILNGEIEEYYFNSVDTALKYYKEFLRECEDSIFLEPIRLHIRQISEKNI